MQATAGYKRLLWTRVIRAYTGRHNNTCLNLFGGGRTKRQKETLPPFKPCHELSPA